MYKLKNLLFISLLFILTGCGFEFKLLSDLNNSKVIKKELDTSRFRANCDLDLNRFTLILHEPIASDIRCLQSNINLFINLVENERPGHMSRAAFEAYLNRYRKDDISPDIISAIRGVYELNYLLTGDDKEYISKPSVDKIFNFLQIFNSEAARYFSKTFQDESAVTYKIHSYQRDQVKMSALRIMSALRQVHNPNGNEVRTVKILELLKYFTTAETAVHIAKIEELLFAKKVLLGGSEQLLTHREIGTLIRSFPELTVLGLDAIRYKFIDLNQKSLISLINNNLVSLDDIIYENGNRNKEDFFTIKQVMKVAEMFVPKKTFDLEKYNDLIIHAKQILMGGDDKKVTGADFRKFMDHALKVLKTGEAFHAMYENFLVPLESKLGPLVINYEQNRDDYLGREEEFKRFIRIVKDYRFMKGEFESPYYSREWWRNSDAFFEIYLFEYLIEQIFAHKSWEKNAETGKLELVEWGVPGSASGVFSHNVTAPKFESLVKRFKDALVEMDLIMPGRYKSISDTISLLATLFQYQSSQVEEAVPSMDVNEASEFALTLVSGMGMAKEITNDLLKVCPHDKFDRIEPVCFKQNYFKTFCSKYKRNYPLMFQDIGVVQSCDDIVMNEYNSTFLEYSIYAARSCNVYHDGTGKPTTEEIYYAEGDIMTILVAQMHIEATMIRWDKNRNNKWDPSEANLAYSVYSTALDGFLEGKPGFIKGLKKEIYYYLLKYEDVPTQEVKNFKSLKDLLKDGGRLAKLWFGIGKPGATRKTMAAVLKAIGTENAKMRISNGDKEWDCNLLKDPNSIPNDYDPDKP